MKFQNIKMNFVTLWTSNVYKSETNAQKRILSTLLNSSWNSTLDYPFKTQISPFVWQIMNIFNAEIIFVFNTHNLVVLLVNLNVILTPPASVYDHKIHFLRPEGKGKVFQQSWTTFLNVPLHSTRNFLFFLNVCLRRINNEPF